MRLLVSKLFCKKCVLNILNEMYLGWKLATHIDTRSVEFMAGLLSIIVGGVLMFPPYNTVTSIYNSISWGWLYICVGGIKLILSVYGPYKARKYFSLIDISFWIFLMYYLWLSAHNIDEAIIIVAPYMFFTVSSMFTYLGLWRIWDIYDSK